MANATVKGKEVQSEYRGPKPKGEQKLAAVAGAPLMVKRDQTLQEFQREQRELDAMLLEKALEQDRLEQEAARERAGIVKQSEICLFCNLQDMFAKYAND